MGHSNSLRPVVRTETVEIRLPRLDGRRGWANELGHPPDDPGDTPLAGGVRRRD